MTRIEQELHQIDLTLETIESRLQRMIADRQKLLDRRAELIRRKRGEHQPPLEGWDVT